MQVRFLTPTQRSARKSCVAAAVMTLLFGLPWSGPARAQEIGPPESQGHESPSQSSDVEQLKEEMKALKKEVEDLKRKRAAGVGQPPPPPVPPPLSPGTIREVPEGMREREHLRQDPYAAARVDNAPFDPDLKGFFLLPGTRSMFRFGGFVRTDVIYDTTGGVNTSKFVTSSIPTGPNPGSNTSVSAAPSRLSFEIRSNLTPGILRIYYENDFNNGPDATFNYRVRHFYGQLKNLLVGQTWSTFEDADAIPDTVDFEGPNSWIFRLQPQIRYTYALSDQHHVSVSVEEPGTEAPATTPTGQTITATSPTPDFTVRYRYELKEFHIQTAGLFRSLATTVAGAPRSNVLGYGVMFSGAWTFFKKDNIMWQLVGGEGIARYINDLGAGSGLDVGLLPGGGIKAQPAYGGYASVQHYWAEKWRSAFTYSFFQLNSTSLQPANTFKQTQYAEGNLMYSPGAGFTMGLGLLWGQRVDKGGDHGDDIRLDFVLQYDLVH